MAFRRRHSTTQGAFAVWALLFTVCLPAACATFGRHRLDYTSLTGADRVEVRDRADRLLINITDPQKVQYAVEFIVKRQDRWGDRISPYVPALVLQFYVGERQLGGYGISSDVLIAFPVQHGFWWRDVAPAEISALLKTLEIEMPRRVP